MPQTLDDDTLFMRRALALAVGGRGRVEPNPMVGCVIVREGRVIGEGHHAVFGGPHAEPAALAHCTESPRGATAYVTLEPCCHTGKKTPPCAPRLVEAGLARVVIGCLDPNPAVDGGGVAMLRAAGVRVDGPVLEAPCRQVLAPFIARVRHGRPYVTLKWAQTADGRIAGPGGARLRISNDRSMRAVHELRARCDAILVGLRTVLADDPVLTVRGVEALRPLTRCVLDAGLAIPLTSRLVQTARDGRVVVFCGARAMDSDGREKAAALRRAEVEVRGVGELDGGGVRLAEVGAILAGEFGATHLLVEPGPRLAAGFMAAEAAGDARADRVWVFRSPRRVDDPTAPAAPGVPADLVPTGRVDLDGDELTEFFNPRSEVYFAPDPSADLILTGGGRTITPPAASSTVPRR